MFGAPRLVFGGTEGVRSRFNVLRSRTHFRRYQGRRVSFSCFARPCSFLAVQRASGPVFMLCAPGHIFGVREGVGSHFFVLRARTHFRRYRERREPVFMFCAHRLVFGGTEGIGSHFHVLRPQTRFRRYRGRRVLFSC
jgi:hypothetical protein